MKARRLFIAFATGLSFLGADSLVLPSSPDSRVFAFSAPARQSGNTIRGHIFGGQREPVGEVTVELLDDFSRTISRTRTNASGYFFFGQIPAGRFRVRVLPYEYNYEEQEQDIEIVNITRETNGMRVTSGFENVQRDFYLRPRKGSQIVGRSESIFVQEIPEQAKITYKRAVESLDAKKVDQALKDLKTAIEMFPDYYDAIERLGMEYVKLQHYEAAEILLSRAVQINPRGYKSWYGLGYAQYSRNKTNQAIESVTKAVSLNQFSVDSLLLQGVLYKKSKDYKQAEKQLKKAKELAKGSVPEINWQLALLYGNNLNRYREAADELEIFLKTLSSDKNADDIRKLIKMFRNKAQNNE